MYCVQRRHADPKMAAAAYVHTVLKKDIAARISLTKQIWLLRSEFGHSSVKCEWRDRKIAGVSTPGIHFIDRALSGSSQAACRKGLLAAGPPVSHDRV
jgi:hypothetical protein